METERRANLEIEDQLAAVREQLEAQRAMIEELTGRLGRQEGAGPAPAGEPHRVSRAGLLRLGVVGAVATLGAGSLLEGTPAQVSASGGDIQSNFTATGSGNPDYLVDATVGGGTKAAIGAVGRGSSSGNGTPGMITTGGSGSIGESGANGGNGAAGLSATGGDAGGVSPGGGATGLPAAGVAATGGDGINGRGGDGVTGTGGTGLPQGIGVHGLSGGSNAVQGDCSGRYAGLAGFNSGIGIGVAGIAAGGVQPAGSAYGVYGDGGTAIGVYGHSSSGDGIQGYSDSTGAGGVAGFSTNSNASAHGTYGSGPIGVWGASSTNVAGVVGTAGGGSLPASGTTNIAVYGDGGSGTGVEGLGNSYGVYGSSPNGAAVFGFSTGSGRGVQGDAGGSGAGGSFSSNSGPQLHLSPKPSGTTGHPGTGSGNWYKGDLFLDSLGALFICTSSGTPGTWSQVQYVGSTPTNVRISRFTAHRTSDRVHFAWHLNSPVGIVGFDLYAGKRRLNERTISLHRSKNYRFEAPYAGHDPFILKTILDNGAELSTVAG